MSARLAAMFGLGLLLGFTAVEALAYVDHLLTR